MSDPIKLPFAFRYVLPGVMAISLILITKSLIEWVGFGQPFDGQALEAGVVIFLIAATVRFLGASIIRWQIKQH